MTTIGNEDLFRLALKNRAERLLKLLELGAPRTILGAEAWLIMKATMGLGKDALGPMIADMVWKARNGMACCVHEECGGKVDATLTYALLCPSHEAEQEREGMTCDDIDDSDNKNINP